MMSTRFAQNHHSMKNISFILVLTVAFVFSGCLQNTAYAESQSGWTTVQINHCLNGIVYGDHRFVIVGSEGLIKTSDDGNTWTVRESGTDASLYMVKWLGNHYICVGNQGTVLTSTDGINWNKGVISGLQGSTDDDAIFDVAWDGSRYTAVFYNDKDSTSGVLLSIDGKVWTATKSFEGDFECIEYGDGLFIAVSYDGIVMDSRDGKNWTKETDPLGTDCQCTDIAFDGQFFIIMGGYSYDETGTAWVSDNGSDWFAISTGTGKNVFGMLAEEGAYIAAGSSGAVLLSNDGVAWTSVVVAQSEALYGVAVGNNTFVFVGTNETLITRNAAGWKDLTPEGFEGGLFDVSWNGTQFETVGTWGDSGISKDGLTWERKSWADGSSLNCVVWDGKQYIGGGTDFIASSSDGKEWGVKAELKGCSPEEILYANGMYVLVADAGKIYTSTDGSVWTLRDSKIKSDIYDIAWNGKQFVAVGDDSAILCSQNGIDWTAQAWKSAEGPSLTGICWDGRQFIVVGSKGTILRSKDGINWTGATGDAERYYMDIVWNGYQYTAPAENGSVYSSIDAKKWNVETTSCYIYSIAWNGYRFVGVGTNGYIYTEVPTNIVKIIVDKKPLMLDAAPIVKDGRTMVPLRSILESLGAEVTWDATTHSIDAIKAGKMIHLQLDSKQALVDGKPVTLEVAATSVNGRVMVPIRFVSEALGCKVTWDGESKTVNILPSEDSGSTAFNTDKTHLE